MFKELGQLAWARVLDAVVLAALIQVLFWLFLWFFGKQIKVPAGRRWALIVVSTLCLTVTLYLGISAAHYLTAQVNAIRLGVNGSGPTAIRASVYRCAITKNAPGDPTVASFNVRLTNPGRPTTAWAWSMRMTLPGRQSYDYQALDIRTAAFVPALKPPPEDNETNGLKLVLTAETYLPEILLERSIGPDRGASGWVSFIITNVPRTEITKGTKFVLEFEQGDGAKKTIEHIWEPPD